MLTSEQISPELGGAEKRPESNSVHSRRPERPPVSARGFALGVAGVIAIYLALSLHGLGSKPFWVDEAFTALAIRLPFDDLLKLLKEREANGALHYILLSLWDVAGNSETALRLFSVLAGAVTVGATALLGESLSNRRTGIAAAFLLATSLPFLKQAQTARTGTLTTAIAVLAMLAFVRAFQSPTWFRLTLWVVTDALLCYAHLFGFLIIAAQFVVIACCRPYKDWARTHLRSLMWACKALFALVSPLLLFVATQDQGQVDWIAPLSLSSVNEEIIKLTGGKISAALAALAFIAGLATLRGRSHRKQDGVVVFLLSWLAVPPVIALVVSIEKPIFVARYLVIILPAIALLIAVLAERFLIILAVAALVAAVSLLGLVDSPLGWYEDWPAALETVADSGGNADPGAPLAVTDSATLTAVRYHLDNSPLAHRIKIIDGYRSTGRAVGLWVIARGNPDGKVAEYSVTDQAGRSIKPARTVPLPGVFVSYYETPEGFIFIRGRN